ncbi:hypothetical protein K438DRAFT_1854210 [Mycena galopus ATCC 62051]|nr:hypothetical protein K438DRAFT_1854210 [Mycena galopus ATCC 62051]
MNQVFQAAAATVSRLRPAHMHAAASNSFLLVAKDVSPPSDLGDLEALVSAAGNAATSVSRSSIIAGGTSESDDFGDAAVWLGPGKFGIGQEHAVLTSLGLKLDDQQVTISPVDLAPADSPLPHIPTTVNASDATDGGNALEALSQRLTKLQDLHCFRLETGSSSDVIFALVGRKENAWSGLVSIATWS